ncbi:M20/M25/M40 family metallo-hydrolase [Adhaeribacter rhizoryzae]|uniref:M20 family metallopeptidase n=1 Tax=Adhaeribacter rhizoryzae TaxID=2607907 RepID=A0A5M6D156_9BACT|nr:M20/M25/M40 family metallo-hydrolase [Adhaeribacter rhizoryzae]KAA5541231.1 M20 family metallopeptidase [Adhaeribacter rhizoryzae]
MWRFRNIAKLNIILGALAFGSAANLQAQQLSATEKKILATVTQNMPATEKLLEQVVNINSGTLNVAGVKEVGNVFGKELTSLGFTTTWLPMPDSMRRAGHLVAQRKGHKGKKLLLLGHLDTVFEPDMPPNPYQRLNDSTATGQGVNDMKGGDVVIIAALKALAAHGLLKNTAITVYFTGDEENSGKPTRISRQDFINRAKESEVALAFEYAADLHTVATARRGSSSWELQVTGQQRHSSTIFSSDAGYGAIFEASRILNDFRKKLSQEKYLTFSPGLVAGGTEVKMGNGRAEAIGKTNIIAPQVKVSGDLRFLTENQKEKARTHMKEIVAQHLPGTSAQITFSDGIPAMEPTKANIQLARLVSDISEDMGLGKVKAGDPGARGAGDISYIAAYVPGLDGLGVTGKGAHAPGETINLKELPLLIQRTALLLYRLTR